MLFKRPRKKHWTNYGDYLTAYICTFSSQNLRTAMWSYAFCLAYAMGSANSCAPCYRLLECRLGYFKVFTGYHFMRPAGPSYQHLLCPWFTSPVNDLHYARIELLFSNLFEGHYVRSNTLLQNAISVLACYRLLLSTRTSYRLFAYIYLHSHHLAQFSLFHVLLFTSPTMIMCIWAVGSG